MDDGPGRSWAVLFRIVLGPAHWTRAFWPCIAIGNQPTVLFSQNKPASAISDQPNEEAESFFTSEKTAAWSNYEACTGSQRFSSLWCLGGQSCQASFLPLWIFSIRVDTDFHRSLQRPQFLRIIHYCWRLKFEPPGILYNDDFQWHMRY
jgi:hypothetical protein